MEILSRFERRAIEAIETDNTIDVDNYDNVGRYLVIKKIKKAIGMAFRKDWTRSSYSLDDILKTGNLWN